jgi:hypothetical protein
MGRHPVNADKVVCMVEERCSAFFKQANRARPLLVFVSHLLNASMVSTCGFGKLAVHAVFGIQLRRSAGLTKSPASTVAWTPFQ